MARKSSLIASFFVVVILSITAFYINSLVFKQITKGYDIYASYSEGQHLLNGENPYARIQTGDMRTNQKYATYFPVFYELSYLSQAAGFRTVKTWIGFWRIIFVLFELATAIFLYVVLAKNRFEWVGVFAAAFWLFNRWTLNLVETQNLDFIPIFLFLVSLTLFSQKRGLSLLLCSCSLGFKQIAIFAVPLYLIWEFRETGQNQIKHVLKSALMIAIIPLVTGLPFLFWDASAFLKSILFSATRLTGSYSEVSSLDVLLKWDGLPARAVMLALMLFIYLLAFKGQLPKYFSVLLVMIVFVGFNNTLFPQYLLWVMPLILLAVFDWIETSRAAPKESQ